MLFYFFFAYGIFQSFWSVWLEYQEVSVGLIGLTLGCGAVVRGIVNLVITPLLSRAFFYTSVLLLLSFLITGLHLASDYAFYLFLMTMFVNVVFAPVIPLTDAIFTQMAKLEYIDYGRVRIWGTIGFIAGVMAVGYIIEQYGKYYIPHALCAILLINFAWSLTRPRVKSIQSLAFAKASWKDLAALFKDSVCARLLILVSLLQASHGAYYSFSAIWWQKLGFSYTEISYFWTFSMLVEIAVFAFGQKLLGALRIQHLLYLTGLSVVVRWTITAFASDSWSILLAQTLHGMTYAATHLLMIRFIQESDISRAVPLQSAYNGLSMCLFLGGAAMLSGWLFGLFEGYVFLFMALLGFPALIVSIEPESSLKKAWLFIQGRFVKDKVL
tara:strand:- start:188 stop:1339 length:1152 start_codon:yes stop_codon:yes gene_type:complete